MQTNCLQGFIILSYKTIVFDLNAGFPQIFIVGLINLFYMLLLPV